VKHGRHNWIIATKFGHHLRGQIGRTVNYDPNDVRHQVEASLKALQTGHIDAYQFHSGVNSKFQTPGLWEALDELVRAGKVPHLGISVSPNDNLFQVERATDVNARVIRVVYTTGSQTGA
jgi:aryl-alcohol dehydrogenase-like predicted oxidoreductase